MKNIIAVLLIIGTQANASYRDIEIIRTELAQKRHAFIEAQRGSDEYKIRFVKGVYILHVIEGSKLNILDNECTVLYKELLTALSEAPPPHDNKTANSF